MNHAELIEAMGGTCEVATFCSVKAPSVSGWKSNGIPADRLIPLAVEAERRGVCTRKKLFPKNWRAIWPELAKAA